MENIFITDGNKIFYGFKNKILPLCKTAGIKTDSGDQQPDIFDTPKQKGLMIFYSRLKKSKEI